MTLISYPKGIDMINLDNGYFNNVLYVPNIAEKLLSMYKMAQIGSSKRLTFTQEDMEILEISIGQVVAMGIADHEYVKLFTLYSLLPRDCTPVTCE